MGSWYWIGVAAGLGTAAGIVLGALLSEARIGWLVGLAVLLAIAAGIGIGLLIGGWAEAALGAVGGLLGVIASAPLVAGALRGGGTRLGVVAIVCVAGLVVAALAFVPIVGYLELVAAPLVALRLRRSGGERYAGLRILARD